MEDNTNMPHIGQEEVSKQQSASASLSIQQAILLNACIIGLAIILAAVIMHGTFGAGTLKDPAGSANGATTAVDIKNVKLGGEPFIGSPNAPVVFAYWSDYQCPYCKKFETTTFARVVSDYVNSGKVAVVFKDYAFLGADSDTAALYGRAVWHLYPDQFFAWRTAMFDAQDEEGSGFGDEPSIIKLTGTIAGIDAAKVKADVTANSDAYQKAIDADRSEGVTFGIGGTPSLIIGTKLVPGYVDYTAIAPLLDAQLKG